MKTPYETRFSWNSATAISTLEFVLLTPFQNPSLCAIQEIHCSSCTIRVDQFCVKSAAFKPQIVSFRRYVDWMAGETWQGQSGSVGVSLVIPGHSDCASPVSSVYCSRRIIYFRLHFWQGVHLQGMREGIWPQSFANLVWHLIWSTLPL